MRDKSYYEKIYDLKSWQGFHVTQLSYLRNLIVVLALAVLGFTITLLINNKFSDCETVLTIKIIIGLLIGSLISGLTMAYVESENFRLKYKIARLLKTKDSFSTLPNDIASLQTKCDTRESINRVLIVIQLVLFGIPLIILGFIFFNY